jgi:phage terminase large subunit
MTSVSHVTVPTSNEIANRAYSAMHKPPDARVSFERILGLSDYTMRRVAWFAMTADEQAACSAYTARRLELRDVYGDAAATMQAREDCLAWLRRDDTGVKSVEKIAWVKRYYGRDADTLADFINDWGYTVDPRLINENKNPVMAFALFPKQREMVRWFIGCWLDSKPGVVVKSRDVGASWVAMALLSALCIFRNGFAAGVGSAVEIKIDRSGDPDTLFYKIRSFLEHLPAEFNGGFNVDTCSADKRVSFPLTGSSITGEAGDQAGRGGRKAIFVVDESAHFEHPKIIDKNLSANTKCRIDMSSVNGMANSFYTRAHNPAIRRFDFTWRDDPRKNYEGSTWYATQAAELDEIVLKQEIDCDFAASLEGVCIPSTWVQAAIDIDKFLGIDMESGAWRAALDIADRGNDKCALVLTKGRKIKFAAQWSGKASDTGYSVQRAMAICESWGIPAFDYDADGMGGAAVHSDARLINEARGAAQQRLGSKPGVTPSEYFAHGTIGTHPYRGSEAVIRPEAIVPGTKRKAKDLFTNRKAQTWYEGRLGFFNAWKARTGKPYDASRMICIAGELANEDGKPSLRDLLVSQLSQATVKETIQGKIQIEKAPDDVASPDVADAALMTTCPRKSNFNNMGALLATIGGG